MSTRQERIAAAEQARKDAENISAAVQLCKTAIIRARSAFETASAAFMECESAEEILTLFTQRQAARERLLEAQQALAALKPAGQAPAGQWAQA